MDTQRQRSRFASFLLANGDMLVESNKLKASELPCGDLRSRGDPGSDGSHQSGRENHPWAAEDEEDTWCWEEWHQSRSGGSRGNYSLLWMLPAPSPEAMTELSSNSVPTRALWSTRKPKSSEFRWNCSISGLRLSERWQRRMKRLTIWGTGEQRKLLKCRSESFKPVKNDHPWCL